MFPELINVRELVKAPLSWSFSSLFATLPSPTFAAVVPSRIAEVASVFAPSPPAVTCPPPPPLSVPFAAIESDEFVKVAILVKPVPPFDAGKVPEPIKLPSSEIVPVAICAATILFVVIFPPSIVVVFELIIVAGLKL